MGNIINSWENTSYSATSEEWFLLDWAFPTSNQSIRLYYDEIDTALANMSFKKVVLSNFVFQRDQEKYLEDMFEAITDYKKIVFFLMFLVWKDDYFLHDSGF